MLNLIYWNVACLTYKKYTYHIVYTQGHRQIIFLFLAVMSSVDCAALPALLVCILLCKASRTLWIFSVPPAAGQPWLGRRHGLEFVWLLLSWSFRMMFKECN